MAYLLTLCITLTVYAKFIVVEQIFLFGLLAKAFNAISPLHLAMAVPAGTLPFAVTYPICDIVAEVYGPKPAKRLMISGIVGELIFALGVLMVIGLPAMDVIVPNEYYHVVHGSILIFAISNIIGSFVGKTVNIYLIAKLKVKWLGRAFCQRSLFSTMVGELLLSLVAATISFAQNLPMSSVIMIAITAFFIKMTVALVMVKPIQWVSAYLKRAEGIDVYDKDTNLNPFDIALEGPKELAN
mgnify:CR=1 FL=1